jgi:predicted MPP superfamily phosphohydrolase
MAIQISQLFSIFIYGFAGLCVYLILLNRYLIWMVDSWFKTLSEISAFIFIIGLSVSTGWFYHGKPWIFIPLFILGLVFAGEVRRLIIRYQAKGSPPVSKLNLQSSIFRPVTTTNLVTYRYELSSPELRTGNLRIAHITDLHINSHLPFSYYEKVIETVIESNPDLIFLTGDFFTDVESLLILEKWLKLTMLEITFAVLGNHDYWVAPDKVKKIIKDTGVRLLTDETISVEIQNNVILLTGIDYPWSAKQIKIPSDSRDNLHLVLTHNPDNIYKISKLDVDCVFSGHFHAGQIRVPWFGPLVIPSKYGRRFDLGHFIINDTHLFVSAGAGVAHPLLRVYCQPDVMIVDLLSCQNK